MKMYQIKVKVCKPGFKNKFFTGLSVAKTPELAKKQAVEVMARALLKQNKIQLDVEVTKCKLVKQDFFLTPKKD